MALNYIRSNSVPYSSVPQPPSLSHINEHEKPNQNPSMVESAPSAQYHHLMPDMDGHFQHHHQPLKLAGSSLPLTLAHSSRLNLGLRAVQTFLSFIVMAFSAFVIKWWLAYWHESPASAVSLLLFDSILSLLLLGYILLAPAYFPSFAPQLALLAADCVALIFNFSSFVNVSVFLSGRVCFGAVCSILKAATAMTALAWIAFCVSAIFTIVRLMRSDMPFTKLSLTSESTPKTSKHVGIISFFKMKINELFSPF